MVSIDVVGLYPHIPHDEGLDAIRHALNGRQNQKVPTNLIVDLAELVFKGSTNFKVKDLISGFLKHNQFRFNTGPNMLK